MSIVSTSPDASVVVVRVPEFMLDWFVVVIEGFVVANSVVPFLFTSTVRVPLQAVQYHRLTFDIVNVQSATKVFATFVPVAHIFQAIENTRLILPQPAALRVVPESDKLVPSVISSIAPVDAVHLPSSLLVLIVIQFVVTAQAFTIFTHSIDTTPADTRDIVVSLACQSSTEPAVKALEVQYSVFILQVVSSPVFVQLAVPPPVTRVHDASGRVQVLAAVIVFVNNPVNVFATFRNPILPSRNVFSHTENVDTLSTVGISFPSTANTPAALLESVVSDACPRSIVSAANACDIDPASAANVAIPQSYTDFTEGYFVLLA